MSTFRGASALSVAVVLLAVTGCHSSGSKAAAGSPSTTSTTPRIILPSDATSPSATAAAPAGAPASTASPPSASPASPTTTSGSGSKGSKSKDPCVLITGSDIAKVTGLSVGPPRPSDVGTQKLCSYSHTDPNQDNEFAVLVTVVRDPQTRDNMEYGRKLAAGVTTAVPGLGTDAYWDENMATLYVLAGSQVFEVAFGGNNEAVDARAKASSIAVARIALTRL
jgi:hypothetical protein